MKKKGDGGAGREGAPIVLYTTPDGAVRVNVMFRNNNLWFPQAGMAELFGVSISNKNRHLKNIFESGELEENSVVSKMETTDISCDTLLGGAVVKQYFTTDSVCESIAYSPLQGEFGISVKVENSGIMGNELLSVA